MTAAGSRAAAADELAARPYAFALTAGADGIYTVQVLEAPGAISEGETPDEALANGRDALAGVFAVMLERGQEVPDPLETSEPLPPGGTQTLWTGQEAPDPLETSEFSATTQLRIPPSLNARAVALARRDNVSLNRFLATAVAHYVGYVSPPASTQLSEPEAAIES